MPASTLATYEPHLAYVENDEWVGVDMIYFDGQLVGTRISFAPTGEDVSRMMVNVPDAVVSVELTATTYGPHLRAVADGIVDALIECLFPPKASSKLAA